MPRCLLICLWEFAAGLNRGGEGRRRLGSVGARVVSACRNRPSSTRGHAGPMAAVRATRSPSRTTGSTIRVVGYGFLPIAVSHPQP